MQKRWTGVWVFQLLEYAVALMLASYASRAADPIVPALVAGAVLLNAALFDGPLSAFRVFNTATHRALGIFLGLCSIAIAFIGNQDITNRATLILTGVAEVFISVRFGYGIRTTRSRSK